MKKKKRGKKRREKETEQEKETDPSGTLAEANTRVSRSKPDEKTRKQSKNPKRKKPCVKQVYVPGASRTRKEEKNLASKHLLHQTPFQT